MDVEYFVKLPLSVMQLLPVKLIALQNRQCLDFAEGTNNFVFISVASLHYTYLLVFLSDAYSYLLPAKLTCVRVVVRILLFVASIIV